MSADKITADTIRSWHIIEDGNHYNGGPSKFITAFNCIENPRLVRVDTHYRGAEANRRHKRGEPIDVMAWKVDGQPCDSMEDAAERLNHPVVLTEKEQWLLDKLTDSWVPMKRALAEWAGIAEGEGPLCINDHEELHALHEARRGLVDKNMIETGRLECPPDLDLDLEKITGRKHRTIPAMRRKPDSGDKA